MIWWQYICSFIVGLLAMVAMCMIFIFMVFILICIGKFIAFVFVPINRAIRATFTGIRHLLEKIIEISKDIGSSIGALVIILIFGILILGLIWALAGLGTILCMQWHMCGL